MKILLGLAGALVALTVAASPAVSGSPTLLDDGRLTFDYAQFPMGPYAGTFSAEGSIAFPPEFPAGSGATYGLVAEAEGIHYLLVVGGVRNLDETVDAAFLYLTSTIPFEPGTYPLDPATYSITYGFVDGATSLTFPENPHEFDWNTASIGAVTSSSVWM